jgi:hypothetical protein
VDARLSGGQQTISPNRREIRRRRAEYSRRESVLINEMRAMTVTEIPRRLEPVTRDTFVASAEEREIADGRTNREADVAEVVGRARAAL